MAIERKYGALDLTDQGIPMSEPIFILRAKDAAAVVTLENYVVECEALGSPQAHLAGVNAVRADFEAWAAENTTKVPD